MPWLLSDRSPLAASALLGVLVASWHAPLFVIGAYTNMEHVLFIFTTTVLYTLVFGGTRGSVCLAMIFHTGWNLAPEFVVPAFQGAALEQALRLYLVIGVAVSVLVVGSWSLAMSIGKRTTSIGMEKSP